ncbi:MAG: xylulokinase [Clostridia bacterium]|nr:xylulokinase [Clostridia bacterium]MBQ3014690.1 xylulokinase [Clostridia bacterium]
MKYLLGIDFGGGALKATLLAETGEIVSECTVEYPTLYPEAHACEQSPQHWIDALCQGTRSILCQSGVSSKDIEAVAVDSATHTSIVCDADMKPLRNAIHWTDSRSRCEAEELRRQYGDEIFKKTFHRPDTIWTLPQLLWLKNHEPENFSKTRHIFFEKDYIRYFLTGVFCTDYIEAEGSMLFDCTTMCWDAWLCGLCGIDVSMLPPVKKPTDVIGSITEAAERATGLFKGTPVICGTTDTVMEVFASGAVEEGDCTVKLATAGRICVITQKPYPDRHMINYSHVIDGLWYPGTATKSAAASYRWYRDTFGGDYRVLDEAAAKIRVGCDGLMFHPYLNGELTPYADPTLCGSFTGMRATHTRAHFTRAVLEGVSLSLLDCKRYLDGLNIPYKSVATLIGGGTKGALWGQITADVLGITLRTAKSSDSSLGSAMLAGVAVGIFKDPRAAAARCVRQSRSFTPIPENTECYRKLFEKYKKIHDALAPIYQEESL